MAISTEGIQRIHVLRAAKRWDANPGYGGYGKSTLYDILVEGNPYRQGRSGIWPIHDGALVGRFWIPARRRVGAGKSVSRFPPLTG